MRIAVLMACYNRVQTTLVCLQRFYAAKIPADCEFALYLVDDNSPDNTGEVVSKVFPSIHIINGSGNLYWCGGMRLAWLQAARQYDYDAYLWLNDDTLLFQDALLLMVGTWRTIFESKREEVIVCGCTTDNGGKGCTYGGRDENGVLLEPDIVPREVMIVNGNCVLIPRRIFRAVGNFADYFTHAIGDFDYSLRARQLGYRSFITNGYVGVCPAGRDPDWIDPQVSLINRVKSLYSPKGSACPSIGTRFTLKHYGVSRAAFFWLGVHLRVLFPGFWCRDK